MASTQPTPDRAAALFLVLHITAMFAGFVILGAAFDFPEVLRYPARERFALFEENQSVIRPTYWLLTMTGLSQILISALMYRCLRGGAQTAALLSLVFGALAGLCQALGFGRWVILVPYLVAEAATPEKALMAELLEGAFNHYAGMLVGEHLANICWGVWLASLSAGLLIATNVSRWLAWAGLALSALLILLAGEQIGVSGAILDPLVAFGFPLLAVWHFLLAHLLWRRAGGPAFPSLGPAGWLAGGALAAGMMAPAFG